MKETKILKELLKRKLTIREIQDIARCSKKDAKGIIRELRKEHFNVLKDNKDFFYVDNSKATMTTYFVSGPTQRRVNIKYGSCSDLHTGCNLHDSGALQEYFKRAINEFDVNRILIAGDLSDGVNIYKGQHIYLTSWTLEDQADDIMNSLPEAKGLEYLVIDGNHDESWIKKGSISPNELASKERDDIKYLGTHAADVIIAGVKIRMLHGAGGGAYAVSYPLQRYLRNVMQSGRENLPDVLHVGHYHTRVDGMHVEGTVATMNGHFQDPNAWYIRRGFVGPKGGHIIEMTAKNGKRDSFNATWLGE